MWNAVISEANNVRILLRSGHVCCHPPSLIPPRLSPWRPISLIMCAVLPCSTLSYQTSIMEVFSLWFSIIIVYGCPDFQTVPYISGSDSSPARQRIHINQRHLLYAASSTSEDVLATIAAA